MDGLDCSCGVGEFDRDACRLLVVEQRQLGKCQLVEHERIERGDVERGGIQRSGIERGNVERIRIERGCRHAESLV